MSKKKDKDVSGYTLSRLYFNWAFDNPSQNNPTMTALYFFLVEVNNRLGWKKEFGITASECMNAIGIGSYNTYKKNFDSLVRCGFVSIIKKSKNQHQCNIIGLLNIDKAGLSALSKSDKALDKALTKHLRHSLNNKTSKLSIVESADSDSELSFENVWSLYEKKGNKKTSEARWNKLSIENKKLALANIPQYVKATPDRQFRKDFQTYINQEVWNDSIVTHTSNTAESPYVYIIPESNLHPALQDYPKLGVGEFIRNGKRYYGKTNPIEIPMDMPPRPSDKHYFNMSLKQWNV